MSSCIIMDIIWDNTYKVLKKTAACRQSKYLNINKKDQTTEISLINKGNVARYTWVICVTESKLNKYKLMTLIVIHVYWQWWKWWDRDTANQGLHIGNMLEKLKMKSTNFLKPKGAISFEISYFIQNKQNNKFKEQEAKSCLFANWLPSSRSITIL